MNGTTVVPNRKAWQQLWTDPEMLALPLLTAWLAVNEPQSEDEDDNPMNWSPLACLLDLQDDFDVTVHPAVFNRLMASRSLLLGNQFFASLPDFIRICNILTSGVHSTKSLDLADSHEIVWGITEAMMIAAPDEEDNIEFDAEIVEYIREMLISEGFTNTPGVLLPILGEGLPAVSFDEYSDDVAMSQGLAQNAASRTNDLTEWLTERYFLCQQQLLQLPLTKSHRSGLEKWLAKSR